MHEKGSLNFSAMSCLHVITSLSVVNESVSNKKMRQLLHYSGQRMPAFVNTEEYYEDVDCSVLVLIILAQIVKIVGYVPHCLYLLPNSLLILFPYLLVTI